MIGASSTSPSSMAKKAARHSFGVQNLDDLLAGANHMQRQEWTSKLGLGRHRISSTISVSRAQQVNKQQPRIRGPLFGNQHWIVDLSRVYNNATG
jgi:hypothetical protein